MKRAYALSPEQLECLVTPIRLAIVQRLESDKQATARELAVRLGRPVTSLYHHLKKLEAIGLIHPVGERKGLRRPEAVYALVAADLVTVEAVKTEPGRRAYARSATRIAEAAARTLSAAVDEGRSRYEGQSRNTRLRFFTMRADREKLHRINRLIDQLEACLFEDSAEGGEEMMFTFLMSPQNTKT